MSSPIEIRAPILLPRCGLFQTLPARSSLGAGLSYDTLRFSLLDESELLERCYGLRLSGWTKQGSKRGYQNMVEKLPLRRASESMFVLHGVIILNLARDSSSISSEDNRAATRSSWLGFLGRIRHDLLFEASSLPRLLVPGCLLWSIPNVALPRGARTKRCNLFQKAMISCRKRNSFFGSWWIGEHHTSVLLCGDKWVVATGRGYNYIEIAAVWSDYFMRKIKITYMVQEWEKNLSLPILTDCYATF